MDNGKSSQLNVFNAHMSRLLIGGFLLMLALMLVLSYAATRQMDGMADLTYKMHRHPLTVSNSVLEVNATIVAMHRHMKDVVLANNEKELERAVAAVNADEAKIYKLFDIIGERYLGDQETIQAALSSFQNWKPIRQSVIDHMRNGDRHMAAGITKGIGAKHVELMTVRMESLINFARSKADDFLDQSTRERDSNNLSFILITGLVVFIWAGISFFVITRIRKVENSLHMARQEAEKANSAKSQFLANMSHDLRTPLNAIMGFSDMMMNKIYGPLGDQRYDDYAQDIHSSGDYLVNLINDILDISKIEAGRYPLTDTHIDVKELFATLNNLINIQAHKAGLKIDFIVDDGVRLLTADERAITQIMTNILANSIKFTKPGGHIECRAELGDENQLLFRVSDTGSGMTQEQIEMACEPFHHTNPHVANENKGAGLGLYLCDRLLSFHDATIDIESEIDVGTSITITFPPNRCGALRLVSDIA